MSAATDDSNQVKPGTDQTAQVNAGGNVSGSGANLATSQPANLIQAGVGVLKDMLGPAIKEQLDSALKEHLDSRAIKRPRVEIDEKLLDKAKEIAVDFQHNEQKSPRDPVGYRLQVFKGFQLASQVTSYFIQAGCKDKAVEWLEKIQLHAEVGVEVTLQLASEPRVGLTAADHCFNNIIGTRIEPGEKAEALVRKQRDWALKTASTAMPNSNTGGSSRGGGGSVSGSGGGGSCSGVSRGGGQWGGYDHGGRDSDRYDRGASVKKDNRSGK